MDRTYSLLIVFLLTTLLVSGQSADRFSREAENAYRQSDWRGAEEAYRRAFLETADPATAYNLGNTLYQQGRYDEAAKYFQIATTNGDAEAWHNLGNTYFQLDRLEEGVNAFENALLIDPDDYDTKYNLAQLQRMVEQKKQSESSDGQDGLESAEPDQKDSSNSDSSEGGASANDEPSRDAGSAGDQSSPGQRNATESGGGSGSMAESSKELDEQSAKDLLRAVEQEEKRAQQQYRRSGNRTCFGDKRW